jgi:hypothetical protein
LTLFWLVGGIAGSPAAVLQRYVAAWRSEQPEVASHLFVAPIAPDGLRETWRQESVYLEKRLEALELSLGPGSGIDSRLPFGSLMFEVLDAPPSSALRGDPNRTEATISIEIVRDVTVRGSFFGLFPTASQQTVPVERIGTVTLRATSQDAIFGLAHGQVWRIASVALPGP